MRKIKYIVSFVRMGIIPVRPFIFQTRALFQQNACRFSKNAPTMDDLSKTSIVKRKRPEYGIRSIFVGGSNEAAWSLTVITAF